MNRDREVIGPAHVIAVHYDQSEFDLAMCGIEVIQRKPVADKIPEIHQLHGVMRLLKNRQRSRTLEINRKCIRTNDDYKRFNKLFSRMFPNKRLPPKKLTPLARRLRADMSAGNLPEVRSKLPPVLTMRRPPHWTPLTQFQRFQQYRRSAVAKILPSYYRYPYCRLCITYENDNDDEDGPFSSIAMTEHINRAHRIATWQRIMEIMRLLQPAEECENCEDDSDDLLYEE